jgi:hypothetical protein
MGQAAFYAYAYAFNASLLLVANKLFKPKGETALVSDFSPTNLAQQGSFVPLVFGRRRIGFVFGWVGERATFTPTTRVDSKGSKKKKTATGQTVYSEAGWHMLCVGPARRLRKIYQDGKEIYNTLTERDTTPSGSTLQTNDGTGDTFTIYWGETDQPANAVLGNAGRVGITSRWPFLCYVYWNRKTLGPSPRWPQIEYEVDVEPGAGTLATGDLAAHWDASDEDNVTLSGTDVTQWDDLIGSIHLTPETPNEEPTYTESEIGDLAAVVFPSGGTQRWLDNSFAGGGDEPFTSDEGQVWAVVEIHELPSAGNVGTIFAGSRANHAQSYMAFQVTDTGALRINFRGTNIVQTPDGAVSAGSSYVVAFGSNGTSYEIRVNDVVHTLVTAAGSNNGGWWSDLIAAQGWYTSVTIGAVNVNGGAISTFHGAVGEVLVYETKLAVAGAAETLEYLVNKWLIASGLHDGFARIIGTVLFDAFPHGIGLDSDLFDLASLNAVSVELEDEGLEFSLLARDGEEARALLGGFMQDAGVMLYRHPSTGLYTFATARRGTPTAIPDDMVTDGASNAEIHLQHEDPGASRLIFTFNDRDRAYRETAIAIDADGLATRLSHHRPRRVPLPSVVDGDSAKVIVERRSQEEFAGAGGLTVRLNREARGAIAPNALIELSAIDEVLRVVEVRPDVDGNAVEVRALPDYYGSEPSTYTAPSGGTPASGGGAVEADDQATFIEIPQHLLAPGDPVSIAVLRVRAHAQIAYAIVHVSDDATTYHQVGSEFGIGTGGELLEAIDASDPFVIETGPTLTIAGPPDTDAAEDYSGDTASWRAGRQLAVIGEEIFFVRELVAVSGTTYRLDGLIRARYDTRRAAHAVGAKVYLFAEDQVEFFTDAAIVPGASLSVKAQPVANGVLSLASVTATTKTLVGKGITPPRPCGLRVTAPALGVAAYETGDDVTIRWASRLATPLLTGAGMQGAGTAVGSGVIGDTTTFEIRVYDSGDVLVRTETRSVPRWTYANASLQTDLGGETDFRVEVLQVNGGFYSDAAELEVTAL